MPPFSFKSLFDPPQPSVSARDLRRAEAELGLRFPVQYAKLLSQSNGGKPAKPFFFPPGSDEYYWVDVFLEISFYKRRRSFGDLRNRRTGELTWVHEDSVDPNADMRSVWWHTVKYEGWMPPRAVAVASANMGTGLIYLATASPGRGSVWFLNHDDEDAPPLRLADSLTAFAATLLAEEEAEARYKPTRLKRKAELRRQTAARKRARGTAAPGMTRRRPGKR